MLIQIDLRFCPWRFEPWLKALAMPTEILETDF